MLNVNKVRIGYLYKDYMVDIVPAVMSYLWVVFLCAPCPGGGQIQVSKY